MECFNTYCHISVRRCDLLLHSPCFIHLAVAERRRAMQLIYKAKWAFIILFAITFLFSFAVLFVGGTAEVNRWLLAANLLLIIAQSANVVYAFRNRHKDVGIALLVCLLIGIGLMWAIYIWSWNYTVKALTIGFE